MCGRLLGHYEVKVTARLDHPNVVQVLDFDRLQDGTSFTVMERPRGRTLRAALRETQQKGRTWTPANAYAVAAQTATRRDGEGLDPDAVGDDEHVPASRDATHRAPGRRRTARLHGPLRASRRHHRAPAPAGRPAPHSGRALALAGPVRLRAFPRCGAVIVAGVRALRALLLGTLLACGAGGGNVVAPGSPAPAMEEPAQPSASVSAARVLAELGGHPPAPGEQRDNPRLEPAAIQQVVRGHFAVLRKCYEEGLGRNPNLVGRVAVKFVIDRSGAVSSAEDYRSDMADRVVVDCVVSHYRELVFPKPRGGIVTVVYPIQFNARDDADAGGP